MTIQRHGQHVADLRCPACWHPIQPVLANGDASVCAHCGTRIVNSEGVIDCIPEQTLPGHIPGRIELLQISSDAAQEGWFAAIIKNFQGALHKIAYISDPVRLGWLFHCYDENANDVCVCLGSDWGAQAFPLTRFYKTVYSVDTDMERLRFQSIRAGAEEVHNLQILRALPYHLPLANKSVDLVVLSGLLEWIGHLDPARPPREMQLALLTEAKRVLKPGGQLYLGIENRLGAQYFLGAKDHSGRPFTSLMPRGLADWQARRTSHSGSKNGENTGYHTYTYSSWGYNNLLRRAGFARSAIYWAWPSYSYPRMSGPLDGRSIRYMTEKLVFQAAGRPVRLLAKLALHIPHRLLGLLIRLLAPHFLIVAATDTSSAVTSGDASTSGDAGTPNIQARIVNRTPPPQSFVRLTMGINAQVKTTFLLMNQANEIYKAVRVVEAPGEGDTPSRLHTEETEGILGRPLRPHAQGDITAAGKWLADYHKRTRNGAWTPDLLIDEIGALAESADPLLKDEGYRALLTAYTVRYAQAVRDHPLPRTSEHGDYTLPNVLMAHENGGNALRVIDWEFNQVLGNPLMDVGSFMLSLLRRQMNQGDFPTQITERTPPAWFLDAYQNFVVLPFQLAPAYYLLRVLERVRQQPVSPAIRHLILAQWTPLLRPALGFGIHTDGSRRKRH
ncbi:methyltransferase domain-containing protein [bacterium]|nr:methyltransferase domain-containing protein [bacterium]